MRQGLVSIFNGVGRPLEQRTVRVPDPGPGEVLVRVTACTLCGSDLHSFDGRRKVAVPTVLGHEIIGRVEAIGPGVGSAAVGDRVTWSLVASCGACFYCRRGLPQKCERAVKYGHETFRPGREWSGGLGEYCMLAPGTTVVPLPPSLDDAAACPANCATSTVAAALATAGNLRGGAVLVLGAGMLGLTACAMARAAAATQVICTDPNPTRRARAIEFGATRAASTAEIATVVKDATGGYGVDAVLELSGAPAAFESAMPLTRMGGTVALVGAVFPSAPVPLTMETIVRRNLRVIGVHNYAPADLVTAVTFLAQNPQYPFASLVEQWYPLAEAGEAFARGAEGVAVRVGIRA